MKPFSKKPDVLDALLSGPTDDEDEWDGAEPMESAPDVAVIATEDDDMDLEPEEGTPEAALASVRAGLDQLETMLRKG